MQGVEQAKACTGLGSDINQADILSCPALLANFLHVLCQADFTRRQQ